MQLVRQAARAALPLVFLALSACSSSNNSAVSEDDRPEAPMTGSHLPHHGSAASNGVQTVDPATLTTPVTH